MGRNYLFLKTGKKNYPKTISSAKIAIKNHSTLPLCKKLQKLTQKKLSTKSQLLTE